MLHTALSATHMVDILSQLKTEIKPPADRRRGNRNGHAATSTPEAHLIKDPGGGEMIKVRLQGTKEDMEWLEKQLSECPEIKISQSSEPFSNKGTNKYFRKYLEINKSEEK